MLRFNFFFTARIKSTGETENSLFYLYTERNGIDYHLQENVFRLSTRQKYNSQYNFDYSEVDEIILHYSYSSNQINTKFYFIMRLCLVCNNKNIA